MSIPSGGLFITGVSPEAYFFLALLPGWWPLPLDPPRAWSKPLFESHLRELMGDLLPDAGPSADAWSKSVTKHFSLIPAYRRVPSQKAPSRHTSGLLDIASQVGNEGASANVVARDLGHVSLDNRARSVLDSRTSTSLLMSQSSAVAAGASGETGRLVCLLSGVPGLILDSCLPCAETNSAGLCAVGLQAGGVSVRIPSVTAGDPGWACSLGFPPGGHGHGARAGACEGRVGGYSDGEPSTR